MVAPAQEEQAADVDGNARKTGHKHLAHQVAGGQLLADSVRCPNTQQHRSARADLGGLGRGGGAKGVGANPLDYMDFGTAKAPRLATNIIKIKFCG